MASGFLQVLCLVLCTSVAFAEDGVQDLLDHETRGSQLLSVTCLLQQKLAIDISEFQTPLYKLQVPSRRVFQTKGTWRPQPSLQAAPQPAAASAPQPAAAVELPSSEMGPLEFTEGQDLAITDSSADLAAAQDLVANGLQGLAARAQATAAATAAALAAAKAAREKESAAPQQEEEVSAEQARAAWARLNSIAAELSAAGNKALVARDEAKASPLQRPALATAAAAAAQQAKNLFEQLGSTADEFVQVTRKAQAAGYLFPDSVQGMWQKVAGIQASASSTNSAAEAAATEAASLVGTEGSLPSLPEAVFTEERGTAITEAISAKDVAQLAGRVENVVQGAAAQAEAGQGGEGMAAEKAAANQASGGSQAAAATQASGASDAAQGATQALVLSKVAQGETEEAASAQGSGSSEAAQGEAASAQASGSSEGETREGSGSSEAGQRETEETAKAWAKLNSLATELMLAGDRAVSAKNDAKALPLQRSDLAAAAAAAAQQANRLYQQLSVAATEFVQVTTKDQAAGRLSEEAAQQMLNQANALQASSYSVNSAACAAAADAAALAAMLLPSS